MFTHRQCRKIRLCRGQDVESLRSPKDSSESRLLPFLHGVSNERYRMYMPAGPCSQSPGARPLLCTSCSPCAVAVIASGLHGAARRRDSSGRAGGGREGRAEGRTGSALSPSSKGDGGGAGVSFRQDGHMVPLGLQMQYLSTSTRQKQICV